MANMLLVNPRRRTRRRKTTARKRRRPVTAAKRRITRRRANPIRGRRRANPIRGRRRRSSVRRSRRRNPALRISSRSVQANVMNAIPGALGALGLDVTLGYLGRFIPAALMAGPLAYLTKSVAAIGLGMVAQKAGVKAATAVRMTEGALTVMFHGLAKELVQTHAPQVQLGAYEGSGWNPDYEPEMGVYLPMNNPVQTAPVNDMSAYTDAGY